MSAPDMPSGDVDVSVSAPSMPSGDVDASVSVPDVPSVDVKSPKKGLFGKFLKKSSKAGVEVSRHSPRAMFFFKTSFAVLCSRKAGCFKRTRIRVLCSDNISLEKAERISRPSLSGYVFVRE